MNIETLKPYITVAFFGVVNLALWKMLVSPLFAIINDLMGRITKQSLETTNLVRDFAAYASASREEYSAAKMMLSASTRESLAAEVEKTQSAGAQAIPESDAGMTLTQRG